MSDYKNVEEGVNLYSMSNIDVSDPNNLKFPIEGKLSLTEKQDEYKHNIGLAEETKGTGDCRRYSHLQQREDTGGSH